MASRRVLEPLLILLQILIVLDVPQSESSGDISEKCANQQNGCHLNQTKNQISGQQIQFLEPFTNFYVKNSSTVNLIKTDRGILLLTDENVYFLNITDGEKKIGPHLARLNKINDNSRNLVKYSQAISWGHNFILMLATHGRIRIFLIQNQVRMNNGQQNADTSPEILDPVDDFEIAGHLNGVQMFQSNRKIFLVMSIASIDRNFNHLRIFQWQSSNFKNFTEKYLNSFTRVDILASSGWRKPIIFGLQIDHQLLKTSVQIMTLNETNKELEFIQNSTINSVNLHTFVHNKKYFLISSDKSNMSTLYRLNKSYQMEIFKENINKVFLKFTNGDRFLLAKQENRIIVVENLSFLCFGVLPLDKFDIIQFFAYKSHIDESHFILLSWINETSHASQIRVIQVIINRTADFTGNYEYQVEDEDILYTIDNLKRFLLERQKVITKISLITPYLIAKFNQLSKLYVPEHMAFIKEPLNMDFPNVASNRITPGRLRANVMKVGWHLKNIWSEIYQNLNRISDNITTAGDSQTPQGGGRSARMTMNQVDNVYQIKNLKIHGLEINSRNPSKLLIKIPVTVDQLEAKTLRMATEFSLEDTMDASVKNSNGESSHEIDSLLTALPPLAANETSDSLRMDHIEGPPNHLITQASNRRRYVISQEDINKNFTLGVYKDVHFTKALVLPKNSVAKSFLRLAKATENDIPQTVTTNSSDFEGLPQHRGVKIVKTDTLVLQKPITILSDVACLTHGKNVETVNARNFSNYFHGRIQSSGRVHCSYNSVGGVFIHSGFNKTLATIGNLPREANLSDFGVSNDNLVRNSSDVDLLSSKAENFPNAQKMQRSFVKKTILSRLADDSHGSQHVDVSKLNSTLCQVGKMYNNQRKDVTPIQILGKLNAVMLIHSVSRDDLAFFGEFHPMPPLFIRKISIMAIVKISSTPEKCVKRNIFQRNQYGKPIDAQEILTELKFDDFVNGQQMTKILINGLNVNDLLLKNGDYIKEIHGTWRINGDLTVIGPSVIQKLNVNDLLLYFFDQLSLNDGGHFQLERLTVNNDFVLKQGLWIVESRKNHSIEDISDHIEQIYRQLDVALTKIDTKLINFNMVDRDRTEFLYLEYNHNFNTYFNRKSNLNINNQIDIYKTMESCEFQHLSVKMISGFHRIYVNLTTSSRIERKIDDRIVVLAENFQCRDTGTSFIHFIWKSIGDQQIYHRNLTFQGSIIDLELFSGVKQNDHYYAIVNFKFNSTQSNAVIVIEIDTKRNSIDAIQEITFKVNTEISLRLFTLQSKDTVLILSIKSINHQSLIRLYKFNESDVKFLTIGTIPGKFNLIELIEHTEMRYHLIMTCSHCSEVTIFVCIPHGNCIIHQKLDQGNVLKLTNLHGIDRIMHFTTYYQQKFLIVTNSIDIGYYHLYGYNHYEDKWKLMQIGYYKNLRYVVKLADHGNSDQNINYLLAISDQDATVIQIYFKHQHYVN